LDLTLQTRYPHNNISAFGTFHDGPFLLRPLGLSGHLKHLSFDRFSYLLTTKMMTKRKKTHFFSVLHKLRKKREIRSIFNTWPLWKNSSLVVHVTLECGKLLSNPYYALLMRQSNLSRVVSFLSGEFSFLCEIVLRKIWEFFFFFSVNCEFSAKFFSQFCEIHFSIKKHA